MDGRIRFVYATCGRRFFCIRIKKFADTKISGYVWTGPEHLNKMTDAVVDFDAYVDARFHWHKLLLKLCLCLCLRR